MSIISVNKSVLDLADSISFETVTNIDGKITMARKLGYPEVFYCEWLPGTTKEELEAKIAQMEKYPKCCFNHVVGLPTIKFDDEGVESEPLPLMGFSKRMLDAYLNNLKYSQNKCRGSASSEVISVRYMVFKYAFMNLITNHKAVILPGTSSKLSDEFSIRIKEICDKIPEFMSVIPDSPKPKEFNFKSTGRIILSPASVNAIRGFDNVGDVVLEEVAHWNLEDDTPVYSACQFVHQKTKCHILHVTTPFGRRGFYFDKVWSEDAQSTFYKHLINWREIAGIPVMNVEDLYEDVIYGNFGVEPKKIVMKQAIEGVESETVKVLYIKNNEDVLQIRSVLRERYKLDPAYHNWFDRFFQGIPFEEIVNVPHLILDINEVIAESLESRIDYDQELDNQFTATENRAIGEFERVDFKALDLNNLDSYHPLDYS
mgnify:CR=1 FL=1